MPEAKQEHEQEAEEWRFAPVWRRIAHPIAQMSFYAVLGIGILLVGFLGVWIEEGNAARAIAAAAGATPKREVDLQALRLAYATATLALAAPCLMQLILGDKKMLRIAAILVGSGVLWVAYLVAVEPYGIGDLRWFGRWGLALSVLSWWLANGEDELFQDKSPANAPSGGSTKRALSRGRNKVTIR